MLEKVFSISSYLYMEIKVKGGCFLRSNYVYRVMEMLYINNTSFL